MKLETFAETVASDVAVKANIPISIILEILGPMLLELFKDCFQTEEALLDAYKNPTVIQRFALRLRSNDVARAAGVRSPFQVNRAGGVIADSILAQARKVSKGDALAMYTDIQDVPGVA
jgi:hypothetical protein